MEQLIHRLLDEIKTLHAQALEAERVHKKDDSYHSEQINELVTALSKAQGCYPSISADRENPYFKSNYADLHMILKALRPCLEKNGLSFVQHTRLAHDGSTVLHSRLYHASGQWIETRARITPVKNTPQEYGSCLTYNKRYSAMALLGVTIDKDPIDDDAEGAMLHAREPVAKKEQLHETITKEQIAELTYELAEVPDVAAMVLNKLQIRSLADIPQSKYAVFLQRIREIKQKRDMGK